ncbi:MAG: hypothetical protein H6705_14050 [Myxococcales bacterium]|nr:hypothetical protein [Myxococcales bacterium]
MSTFGSGAAGEGPDPAAKTASSVDETAIDAALADNPMLAAIRGTPDHFALGWDAAAGVAAQIAAADRAPTRRLAVEPAPADHPRRPAATGGAETPRHADAERRPLRSDADDTHPPSGDDLGAVDGATTRPPIRRLIVCGMGGSAFPADLLALHLRPRGVAIEVSRDYRVRATSIPADALVVASSFSGGTEETLAAYDDAGARGARRVVLAGGGRLAERAAADGVPLIRLAKPFADFQPRAATAMFVGALGRLVTDLGLADSLDATFAAIAARLRALAVEPAARTLAAALDGRIPLILAAAPHAEATARVMRIKLNENAKMAAFVGELPEFNHNAMVGFTRPGPLAVVLLRDPRLPERMRQRMETTAAVLAERGVPVHSVDLPDAEPIEQAFAALYLFDLVSCRLALRAGLDPNPVELIEGFKARLGSTPSTTG